MYNFGDHFEVIGESVTLRLPTLIEVSQSVKKGLNLNIYRNLHYHQLAKQKTNFADKVKKQLENIPRFQMVALHYTIFASNTGRLDIGNVGSIVDKYFSDVLVEEKKLEDDDYTHVVHVSFSFGGVSPRDPHANVTITPVREKNMRIFLDNREVKVALQAYVAEHVTMPVAEIIASTDDNGEISVELVLGTPKTTGESEETPTQTKPKGRGGRPRGSRNKSKPQVEGASNVDEPTETGGDDSSEGTGGATDKGVAETNTAVTEEPESNDSKKPASTNNSTESGGGNKRPNLFGDSEDNQSSEGNNTETPKADTPKTRVKKNSIFDVD